MISQRAKTNSKWGIAVALLEGLRQFGGFLSGPLAWDITALIEPQNLEAFVNGAWQWMLLYGGGTAIIRDMAPVRDDNAGTTGPSATPVVPAAPIPPAPVVLAPKIDPELDLYDIHRRAIEPIDMVKLREDLIMDEGYRDLIYLDTTGHLTAGIGHQITKADAEYGEPAGTRISDDRIQQWFSQDVSTALDDARMLVRDFDSHPPAVRRSLVNMAFNLGRERLAKFKRTISLINARRYAQAADEALNSKWATQVGARSERIAQELRLASADITLA